MTVGTGTRVDGVSGFHDQLVVSAKRLPPVPANDVWRATRSKEEKDCIALPGPRCYRHAGCRIPRQRSLETRPQRVDRPFIFGTRFPPESRQFRPGLMHAPLLTGIPSDFERMIAQTLGHREARRPRRSILNPTSHFSNRQHRQYAERRRHPMFRQL